MALFPMLLTNTSIPRKGNEGKIEHCIDLDVQRLFAFLNPIFHPDRPGQITLMIAIGVVALLEGLLTVNWVKILLGSIQNQAQCLLTCPAFTCIAPFLAHIYHATGCLTLEESQRWKEIVFPDIPKSARSHPIPLTDHELVKELTEILSCDQNQLMVVAKELKYDAVTDGTEDSFLFQSREENIKASLFTYSVPTSWRTV